MVPHRLHGHALQGYDEAEGEGVADHPGYADSDDETEFLGWEDAEEEEEDGEFGEGLDDDVEDLGDVVELFSGEHVLVKGDIRGIVPFRGARGFAVGRPRSARRSRGWRLEDVLGPWYELVWTRDGLTEYGDDGHGNHDDLFELVNNCTVLPRRHCAVLENSQLQMRWSSHPTTTGSLREPASRTAVRLSRR